MKNMRQNAKLGVAQQLLILVLTWHAFKVSEGNPVKRHAALNSQEMDSSCVLQSRALLQKMTETLELENIFSGINCTEQSPDMNTQTQTVSACEPNPRQDTSCRGQRHTKFDKTECLKNIRLDIQYYRSALLTHGRALGSLLVGSIDHFAQHCFSTAAPEVSSESAVSPPIHNPFEERLKLCKAIKGLRIRAVTINRVMSYIAAGDDAI